MYRKIKECLKLESLLIIRCPYTWFLLILWILILSLNSFIILPDEFIVGDNLALSGWISQILIIIGSIIGFSLNNLETKSKSEELIISLPQTYISKKISKVITLLLISVLVFILSIFFQLTGYKMIDASRIYYKSSIYYIFIYWILPFFISSTVGFLISERFKGKIKYILTILSTIITGPMLQRLLEPLINTNTTIFKYISIFNIGPLNISKGINTLFGYDAQYQNIIIRLLFLSFIILLLMSSILMYTKKSAPRIKYTLNFLSFIIFIFAFNYNLHYIENNYNYYISTSLYEKYNSFTSKETAKKDIPYYIKESTLIINDSKNISIQADLLIETTQVQNEINITLYNGFNIRKCLINNNEVKFNINGDCVTLYYTVEPQKSYNLQLYYDGLPLKTMYHDNNGWILPAFFAWYPQVGCNNAIYIPNNILDIKFLYQENNYNTKYKVIYKGDSNLYCSLNNFNQNTWDGSSKYGVTLACGWISKYNENNIEYYYPTIFNNIEKNSSKYLDTIRSLADIIYEDFEFNYDIPNIKKVFFISDLTYTGYGEKLFILSDHMIVWTTQAYSDGNILLSSNMTIHPLLEILIDNNSNKKDEKYRTLFKIAYTENLVLRNRISSLYQIDSLARIEKISREILKDYEFADLCLKIQNYISINKEENIVKLFNKFRYLINNTKNIECNDILKLLEE